MLSKQNQTPHHSLHYAIGRKVLSVKMYQYIVIRKYWSLICINWMYFIKCRHVPISQCLSPISVSGTSRAHWSRALTFLIVSCILLVQPQLKSRNSISLRPMVTTTNGHKIMTITYINHVILDKASLKATLCIHWLLSGTWKVQHNIVRIVGWKDQI